MWEAVQGVDLVYAPAGPSTGTGLSHFVPVPSLGS